MLSKTGENYLEFKEAVDLFEGYVNEKTGEEEPQAPAQAPMREVAISVPDDHRPHEPRAVLGWSGLPFG